jgi:chemotaxis protein CheY-P-specific phosphatase CheC
MDTRSPENFLIHVMNNGFSRAAASFSKLINRHVKILNTHSIIIRHDDDFSYISEEQGELRILTTQIIGDISGKSFLVFNNDESQEIFKALNTSVINDKLNEAFLLEIDNIISASVISELANALNIETYGDAPRLVKIPAQDLRDFMRLEITQENPSSLIFCNTTFQFDGRERIHPQFIWKLNSKIFDLIPGQRKSA